MSTPEPPTTTSPEPPTTTSPEPPTTTSPGSRWRPRGRALVIGAAVLALLIVAGVVFALVAPWRDGPGRGWDHDGRPGIGLAGESGPPDGLGGRDGERGPRGGGPGGWGAGDRGPGGEGLLDLGSDTVLTGSVVSIGNGTLVVTVDGSAQRTLRTDGDTRVVGAGNAALGDLQTGERVAVRVAGTGDAATAVAVLAPQARVTGTVTALEGDRATVVGVDGLPVVADVAALGTKPVVGDVVMITGTVTDGATLTADGIRVLPRAS